MEELRWPVFFAFGVYLAAICLMFYLTDDHALRERLIGVFESLSPFLLGVTVGGTAGGAIGYFRGKAKNP